MNSLLSRGLLIIAILFLALGWTEKHANSEEASAQNSFATVSVFVKDYTGTSVLSSIRDESWKGYRGYGVEEQYVSGNKPVAQFHDVPYGAYAVFIVIEGCIGARMGNFTFGKGVKRVDIIYDVKSCSYSFGFSQ
ncbi:MAG: hypothetical protein HYT93_03350 [Parcubacteria group bacterium]|nr:hypothetical protein [Parcubacteria group bacterium]